MFNFPSPPQRRGRGRGLAGGLENKQQSHLSKIDLTRPLPNPPLCEGEGNVSALDNFPVI